MDESTILPVINLCKLIMKVNKYCRFIAIYDMLQNQYAMFHF